MPGSPAGEDKEGSVREDIKETIFYGLLEKDFGARTKAQDLARLIGIELMNEGDRAGNSCQKSKACARAMWLAAPFYVKRLNFWWVRHVVCPAWYRHTY